MAERNDYIISTIFDLKGWEPTKQILKQYEAMMRQLSTIAGQGAVPTSQPIFGKPFFQDIEGKRQKFVKMGASFVNVQTGKEELIGAAFAEQQKWKLGKGDVYGQRKEFAIIPETMQRIGYESDKVNKTLSQQDEIIKKTGIDYTKLASRAIAVIPIWMALRSAYMAFINTIQMGIKHIVEFDTALAKIRNVVDDVKDINVFIADLKKQVQSLAIETGKSAGDITMAFYAFKDAGLSTTVALVGMNSATRASLVGWTDLYETARSLADVYVLWGDRIKEVTTEQEKLDYISSSIAVLQEKNKFTLQEFEQGLKTFSSTAQAAGLTLDQMLFSLAKTHTFMQRGSTGGSQLARAFLALDKNIDAVRRVLPDVINPKQLDRFALFLKVIETLNARFLEGKDIFTDVANIFEIRGQKSVNAFVTEFQSLIKEGNTFFSMPFAERMKHYTNQIDNAAKSLKVHIDQISKLREQIGEQFLIGITGTDDFEQALIRIRDIMVGIKENADDIGRAVRYFGPMILGGKLLGGPGLIGGAVVGGYNIIADSASERQKAYLEYIEYLNRATTKQLPVKEIQDIRDKLQKRIAIPFRGFGFAPEDYGLDREQIIKGLDSVLKVMDKEAQDNKIIVTQKKEEAKLDPQKVQTLIDISSQYEFQETMLERRKTLGFSELEIEKQRLMLMIQYGKDEKDIMAQRVKMVDKLNQEIIRLSETLQNSVDEGLQGILSGESSIGQTLGKIGGTIRSTMIKQISGGLTSQLFKGTGIGELFGTSMVNLKSLISGDEGVVGGIQNSFEYGAKLTYDMIVKGFTVSTTQGKLAQWAGSTMDGGGYTLPGFGQGGWFNQPIGAKPGVNAGGYYLGGKSGYKTQAATRGQAVGAVGMSALTGYGMYQGAGGKQGGGYAVGAGITGGLGALAMTGAMMGFGAGAGGIFAGTAGMAGAGALAGLGFVVPLIGLALLGLSLYLASKGNKKLAQTSVETRTTENRVASKIDVTNKNLEIINRNLVALRSDIQTYILPASVYFAEKRNLDDEFSLSSRRAYGG